MSETKSSTATKKMKAITRILNERDRKTLGGGPQKTPPPRGLRVKGTVDPNLTYSIYLLFNTNICSTAKIRLS